MYIKIKEPNNLRNYLESDKMSRFTQIIYMFKYPNDIIISLRLQIQIIKFINV